MNTEYSKCLQNNEDFFFRIKKKPKATEEKHTSKKSTLYVRYNNPTQLWLLLKQN